MPSPVVAVAGQPVPRVRARGFGRWWGAAEGDERNEGNVIRPGEDSAREGEGASREKEGVWGGQECYFPLSPSFPIQVWVPQLKIQGLPC